jgi:hypothetical protein
MRAATWRSSGSADTHAFHDPPRRGEVRQAVNDAAEPTRVERTAGRIVQIVTSAITNHVAFHLVFKHH